MEDASALYAAQRFARRLNIPQKTVRLYGPDHERTRALLRSTWEGLRSALRGCGEAGLLLSVSGTQALLDGVPSKKLPTHRSFGPRVCFWLVLIRYFEEIDSERGIAWRASDSLAPRPFLCPGLKESGPDHFMISRTRRRIDAETQREAFAWVLRVAAENGLLKGQTVGIAATTLEANAAHH